MNEFFEKIDNKFKELLDHPVPALLIKENDSLFKELSIEFEPLKAFYLLENFLVLQGYKIISKSSIGYVIKCSIGDKVQHFCPILSNSISFSSESLVIGVEFFVIINPALKRLIFISEKKLDTSQDVFEFTEEYARQNFKIIQFK